jgi:hypothetical protein
MDNFFKTVLTSSMGNDLQNKDLALPQHSDRAHKLLADNDTTVHMSYDVSGWGDEWLCSMRQRSGQGRGLYLQAATTLPQLNCCRLCPAPCACVQVY